MHKVAAGQSRKVAKFASRMPTDRRVEARCRGDASGSESSLRVRREDLVFTTCRGAKGK